MRSTVGGVANQFTDCVNGKTAGLSARVSVTLDLAALCSKPGRLPAAFVACEVRMRIHVSMFADFGNERVAFDGAGLPRLLAGFSSSYCYLTLLFRAKELEGSVPHPDVDRVMVSVEIDHR